MKLEIQTGSDNPCLRTVCAPFWKHDRALYRDIGNQMRDFINNPQNGGIGLAAPQIGITKRLIVCGLPRDLEDENYSVIAMINPEILAYGDESDQMEEGCLSLPELRGFVRRPTCVQVRYTDMSWEEHIIDVSGYGARVIQHEIDHINGVLFIDKIVPGTQIRRVKPAEIL